MAAPWAPAQVGVPGNQEADGIAKEAAEGRTHELVSPASRPRTDPAQLHSGLHPTSGQSAAIGSFLYERMPGPQRVESDECWRCNYGKRQTRHHLFTDYRAWAP